MIPNKNHILYKEWVSNSVIVAIFNNSQLTSSLRGIEVDNKQWNIFKEFFFMSNNKVRNLADVSRNRQCYDDAERLVELSFEKRDEFNRFNDKIQELENEMKPLVYELGFLIS